MEQIKGKKVYSTRFLPPNKCNFTQKRVGVCRASATSTSVPISPSKNKEIDSTNVTPSQTKYPKSVSIGDLLHAGKLVRPPQKKALNLEMFDVENCKWVKSSVLSVEIEETKFDSGTFRDAFRAKCDEKSSSLSGEWVIKKY